jgi:mRNA deadenylase 3'-5' endonuclease subunit Ccr4
MMDNLDFDGLYVQKTKFGTTKTKQDGVALFWQRQRYDDPSTVVICTEQIQYCWTHISFERCRLTLHASESIALHDAYQHESMNPDLRARLRQRDNVGIIAYFKSNHDSIERKNKVVKDMTNVRSATYERAVEVVVATTHLFWDPRQADLKLSQTQHMLRCIDMFRQKLGHDDHAYESRSTDSRMNDVNVHTMVPKPPQEPLAVVFAGDFNSLPKSSVYDAVLEAGYASAYAQYSDENGGEPAFTNCNGVDSDTGTPAFCGTLDYLFYTPEYVPM